MISQGSARLRGWGILAIAALVLGYVGLWAMQPDSAGAQTATPTPTATATGTATATATATPTATATATATPTATPTAPPDDDLVSGDVPSSGVALLTITDDTDAEGIVDALDGMGCEVETLAITVGGQFVVYVPGAPDFVNQDFPLGLNAGSAFIVRCN